MFKKKVDINSDKIDTLIGEGTEFNGKITATGIVRVDGKIEGEIDTKGDLIVGEKGKIRANAKGKNITIAGEVYGNIECTGKLELMPSSKLLGDIKVSDLYIDSGATFQGNCEMNEDSSENNKTIKDNRDKNIDKHKTLKSSKEDKEEGKDKDIKESKDNKTKKEKDTQKSNK